MTDNKNTVGDKQERSAIDLRMQLAHIAPREAAALWAVPNVISYMNEYFESALPASDHAGLVERLRNLVDDQEGGDAVVLVQRQLFNKVVGALSREAATALSAGVRVKGQHQSPPCRICGRHQWVAVWHPERPEQTICIECCDTGQHEHANGETGHEFDRGSAIEVSSCIHCGMERP